jgi:hypothetical protein
MMREGGYTNNDHDKPSPQRKDIPGPSYCEGIGRSKRHCADIGLHQCGHCKRIKKEKERDTC